MRYRGCRFCFHHFQLHQHRRSTPMTLPLNCSGVPGFPRNFTASGLLAQGILFIGLGVHEMPLSVAGIQILARFDMRLFKLVPGLKARSMTAPVSMFFSLVLKGGIARLNVLEVDDGVNAFKLDGQTRPKVAGRNRADHSCSKFLSVLRRGGQFLIFLQC